MPAILPDKTECVKYGMDCKLETRMDDTDETVLKRFQSYDSQIAPVLQHYGRKGLVSTFEVKRGIADWPNIARLLEETPIVDLIRR